MAELSPMMQQYLRVKEEYSDSVVFFRLGDFYEMFFDDAEKISKELDLVLTGRDCGLEERAPMCGVPYHSCEAYISRLVAKGYKVAVCEQMEDPALAKGLVKREVVRVITPGTVIEDTMLDESKNNYLGVVAKVGRRVGVCFVDASTGALNLTEIGGKDLSAKIIDELGRYAPSEILLSPEFSGNTEVGDFIRQRMGCLTQIRPAECFAQAVCEDIVLRHFKAKTLTELELGSLPAAVAALGCALDYLYETQRTGLDAVNTINFYTEAQFMRLDLTARHNLELCETMRNKDRKGSLLWVLDKTSTAMGKRMLRSWIEQPLVQAPAIEKRLNAVEELAGDTVLRGELRDKLRGVYDLERIMAKVVYGTVKPKELKDLFYAVEPLPSLKQLVENCSCAMLSAIHREIDPLEDVYALLESALVDKPPMTSKDGGIIRDGYDPEIDELRRDMTDGEGFITRIEQQERERTGIPKLKVAFNRVFGYYIEVTNSYKDQVPADYIRKQTLTNCERYITEELKTLEHRVLGAKERIIALEYQAFDRLRKQVAEALPRFKETAAAVARLDVFASFAEVAVTSSYTRPEIYTDGRLKIREGRHPVVEAMLKTPFVPNDTDMNTSDSRCAVITGPNMAGKSTYMRQVALITLMAQIGSFVPASSAEIGLADAIYTRVGASDDLAAGQSTFMVEMSEVAFILDNATGDSLLILDEIGRGTSTYDGMSIARAVLEFAADKKRLGARTLFATHYHELTALEGLLDGVKNYNVAVKKRGDDITFLRRIVRGGADDSYGIEVAALAGLPDGVISRAKDVLAEIESGEHAASDVGVPQRLAAQGADDLQFGLDVSGPSAELIERLKLVDVNTLTPIEALSLLHELSGEAKKY